MTATTWVDGRLHADQVSVSDAGYTHGLGVFETLPVVRGNPLHLDRHLARLAHAAPRLGLKVPASQEIREGVQAVTAACGGHFQRLRITLTDSLVISSVTAEPWTGPMTAVVAPWVRNERSPLAGLKCTSYADNVLAYRWAQKKKADEALLFDSTGRLCEGTLSNVFVVLDGEVLTPSLDTGCLPGIVRALVLEHLEHEHRPAHETAIDHDTLARADEVFLTNSVRGVVPVSDLDGQQFSQPGEVTASLLGLSPHV